MPKLPKMPNPRQKLADKIYGNARSIFFKIDRIPKFGHLKSAS
jgi:hypothetical protein